MDVINTLIKAVERLYLCVLMTIGRGKVTAVKDTDALQIVQVQLGSGEVIDNMPRVMEYGFTSVPLPGAHAVAIFIGGDRSNGAVIGTNDLRSRLTGLQPGEVAIYDNQGQKIHLTSTGIVIETPLTLRLQAADVQIHATNSFRFDVNGHGQHWHDTFVDPWQEGETIGTPHPISPPEIS